MREPAVTSLSNPANALDDRNHAAVLDAVATTLGMSTHAGFRPLGRGTDHQAYELADVVVRLDLVDDHDRPARIEREALLLEKITAISPVAVPDVVASRPELGVIVVRKLPGVPLLDRRPARLDTVINQLAEFVAALADTGHADVAGFLELDDTPPGDYLVDVADVANQLRGSLTPSQQSALGTFLDADAPAAGTNLVVCHHDLGAEHILIADDGQTISGILDWSDAAVADPAHDLGRLLRDLGPGAANRCLEALQLVDDGLHDRTTFHARCALLEDLAFGLDTGDHRYSDAALAAFDRVFA